MAIIYYIVSQKTKFLLLIQNIINLLVIYHNLYIKIICLNLKKKIKSKQ